MGSNKTVKNNGLNVEHADQAARILREACQLVDPSCCDTADVQFFNQLSKDGFVGYRHVQVEMDSGFTYTNAEGVSTRKALVEVNAFSIAMAGRKSWKMNADRLLATAIGGLATARIRQDSDVKANLVRGGGIIRNPSAENGYLTPLQRCIDPDKGLGVSPVKGDEGRCWLFAPFGGVEKTQAWKDARTRLIEPLMEQFAGTLAVGKNGNALTPAQQDKMVSDATRDAKKKASERSKAGAATAKITGKNPVAARMVGSKEVMEGIISMLVELYGFDPKAKTAAADMATHLHAALKAVAALRPSTEVEETEQPELLVAVNG